MFAGLPSLPFPVIKLTRQRKVTVASAEYLDARAANCCHCDHSKLGSTSISLILRHYFFKWLTGFNLESHANTLGELEFTALHVDLYILFPQFLNSVHVTCIYNFLYHFVNFFSRPTLVSPKSLAKTIIQMIIVWIHQKHTTLVNLFSLTSLFELAHTCRTRWRPGS